MITKVERGMIDDDFVFDRETLKVYIGTNHYFFCKKYPDGHIVFFRETSKGYEEQPLDNGIAAEIRHRLVMQSLGL